jgi:hypothetical protein
VSVRARGVWWYVVVGALVALAVPVSASAHLERPSYWPDPAPDTSVNPPAGGGVPSARSLASAVSGKGPGKVRVVCQGKQGRKSLRRALRSIRIAKNKGFRVRPSQPKVRYSDKKARRMVRLNRALAKKCRFRHIQPAIDASSNNDRVVIMPGVYTEPNSRKQPENDPRCNPSMLQKDASGDDAPSYAYQVNCPHDQNLVYVAGRALSGEPVNPPREDRRGIPEQELGECLRCNLQIEGSGPRPWDTIIDAGKDYEGTGPEKKPNDHAKHVVLRVDRADGFVGRNMTMRGGLEFGFYVEETDGVFLDKTKFFWNADYGHLSFTTDHHVVQNCDGMGAGDAVLYPGATPETGSQATDFYPDAPRSNTIVRKCDMRGSALGYSGSMGNAVRITNNHIYGNATGIASDTLSSAGHPGFPADSVKVDNNFIYGNNFNVYAKDSPVKPLVGVPVGTGIIFAGMNDARIHDNWFFDNWRDGTMLLAVPDFLTSYGGPEGDVYPGISCEGAPENGLSTSCGNHYFDNRMGQVPPGFKYPAKINQFNVPHGSTKGDTLPNGNDFWWDEFTSNRWNCWYRNTGPDGTPGSVTGPGEAGRSPASPPQNLPDCAGGENQDMSRGAGDPAKTAYLVDCSEGPDEDTGPMDCDWWSVPPKPNSQAAERRKAEFAAAARDFADSAEGRRLQARMEALAAGELE